jgi:hypothetical protein
LLSENSQKSPLSIKIKSRQPKNKSQRLAENNQAVARTFVEEMRAEIYAESGE